MDKVRIKDRNKKIEIFRLACTMSGISINYETADLVYKIFQKMKKRGSKFNISDSAKLEFEHEQRWFAYFKPKSKLIFEEEPKEEEEEKE